ncbi:hypothetical protein TNCV_749411 [Trichonephila clavipes]|nr:hypothetical protein TNCV_749411 [Trichonephila clavipes]
MCEKKTASVFATFKAIFHVENQSSSLAMCLCRKRDGTALGCSSVNFSVSRMDIIDFDREGSVSEERRN